MYRFIILSLFITSLVALPPSVIALEKPCKGAKQLGNDGSKSFTRIVSLLRSTTNAEERSCLVDVLADLDSEAAEDHFLADLEGGEKVRQLQAIQALHTVASQKSVKPLQQLLQEKDQDLVCASADLLGGGQEKSSIPLLAELVDHENPGIGSCAVEALSYYGDPGFCQDFFELWLGKNDPVLRRQAGMAFVRNACDKHVERSGKYAMDSKSCGYTQYFINTVRDAIASPVPGRSLKDVLKELDIKTTIVDKDTPEEIIQMRLNLVFSVMDWGESVSIIHALENRGSLQANLENSLSEIEQYAIKEEFVKQFCPLINFPEFSYWNEIIMKKNDQR